MNSKLPITNNLPGFSAHRVLAIVTAVVFLISALFPLIAGLSKRPQALPKWWGSLDVGLAFLLAILVLFLLGLAKGKVDKRAEDETYRGYRMLIHVIFVMLAIFAVFGDRISWSNCLSGFAWRFWLLLYCLPAWFALLK